jgi:hypothetical protein
MTPASELRGIYQIKGSHGIYLVNTRSNTCTCPGYRFRHHCRHLGEARELSCRQENLERDIADLYR